MIEFIPIKRKPRSLIKYGKLYTWYAATGGTFITGMGIGSATDWSTLKSYILSEYVAPTGIGAALHIRHPRKTAAPALLNQYITAVHPTWNSFEQLYGRNTVRFSALPNGYRGHPFANYTGLGNFSFHWTSTPVSGGASMVYTAFNSANIFEDSFVNEVAMGLRGFRNATATEIANFDDGQRVSRVQDYDGNLYDCIIIGTQVWTKQNIATTRYTNGNNVTGVYDYDNDATNTFFANQSESIW